VKVDVVASIGCHGATVSRLTILDRVNQMRAQLKRSPALLSTWESKLVSEAIAGGATWVGSASKPRPARVVGPPAEGGRIRT
jgi:hypothetical protein